MNDVFTLHCSALPDGARVVGFRGNEAISRPYVFEVYLSVASEESHELDLGDAVSSRATLTLDRQDGRPPFAFHGIFAEVSLLHEMGGRALLRAVLVPHLWRLGQSLHSRVFTAMSLPDIIKETLEDGGLSSDEYAFKLVDEYKPEEHVCQYQESHLDFIARWMEREGLYYYFEQEEEREKLVITDNRASQHELVSDPVRFYALAGGDVTAKECLQTFICRHRSLPGTVRFKDHDYTKPKLNVSGSATVSRTGLGEVSIHGARFFTPDAGKRLATLRAEEMLAREVVFTGSGTSFYLRAGYTFALEDHPRQSFDAKYLATEVEHVGNQAASTPELRRLTGLDTDEVYRVDVTAIPATVQFRAELRTAWPRIYGTEHGVIDGEADSDYAQIDDHGRYVVRFAFDESTLANGKASTRVRMMQPHGGGVEGWHFPLRKGTEVLFTFLGGDPDRPVIAGVVPNMHTPSPVTSGNHTRNVIQTGGRNRLELEDKAGLQRITLSTPHANTYIRMGSPNGANDGHEFIVHTDINALLDAGRDWDVKVGEMLIEDVRSDVYETYHALKKEEVTGAVAELYSSSQHTTVKAQRAADYASYKLYVRGTSNETHQGAHTTQSWASRTIEVGGAHKETSHAGRTSAVIGDWDQNVTGHVKINGAQVSVKASFYKGISSPSFEGFTTKNTAGIHAFSATGVKQDVTGYSFSVANVKGEDVVMSKITNAVALVQMASEIKQFGTRIATAALNVRTYGFSKI